MPDTLFPLEWESIRNATHAKWEKVAPYFRQLQKPKQNVLQQGGESGMDDPAEEFPSDCRFEISD